MKNIFPIIKTFLVLTRFFLSVSVGFTGMVCYIKMSHEIDISAFFIFLGIFLLAAGASSLNQIQERSFDAKMNRTLKRPIPAGKITVYVAFTISILLIIPGLIILFLFGNTISMFVGLFSIIWYNLIYTYLKRTTAYALFLGIFTGIGPIFIGWIAGGGNWFDVQCLVIAAFMSVWQITHFLLLTLRYEDDYRAAGFPLLTDLFNIRFIKAMIVVSTVLISLITLMFVRLEVIRSLSLQLSARIISLIILGLMIPVLHRKINGYKYLLMIVNIYMIFVMMLVFADCWLSL